MRLSEYMAERGLKDETVAKAIRCARPTITRYRNGMLRPGWRRIEAIFKFTKGKVSADDWLEARR